MYFSIDELKAASSALAEARRSFDCTAPRVDAAGNTHWESLKGAKVAYGTHGAAFVQVDPATLAVRCGACAGDVDATAQPKVAVVVKGRRSERTHMVSV